MESIPQSVWAEAVLIVDFDESHGQVIQHLHPPSALPSQILNDIKMLAMPDCLEAGERHEFTFQARIRNKDGTAPFEVLNIYVYFKQRKSNAAKRGYEQRSIVLATRHYFADLCYRILSRFADVIEALPMYQQMLAEPNPEASRAALDSAIEVCFQHFCQWPKPTRGKLLSLPFYGEMFEFSVPDLAPYMMQPSHLSGVKASKIERPGDMYLGEGSGILGDVNLMSVFAPLGLISHLWTLWELILSGQDVVVYSPSAAICSAVVRALATLTAPLACCADMRCYINNYDNDTSLFAAVANKKMCARETSTPVIDKKFGNSVLRNCLESKRFVGDTQYCLLDSIHVGRIHSPQCIIGVTNPFLLRSFSNFQNAVFIPADSTLAVNLSSNSSGHVGAMSNFARLGMGFFLGSSKSLKHEEAHEALPSHSIGASSSFTPPVPRAPPRLFRHGYGPAKMMVISPPSTSLEEMYDRWCASGGAGRSKAGNTASDRRGVSKKTHVLLLVRSVPLVAPDKSILYRLSQFSTGGSSESDNQFFDGSQEFENSDAVNVGGLLLREHFKMMTMTVLKPFDSFFSPVDYRPYAERSASIFKKDNSLSVKRVGAKSLWIYADSATILGSVDSSEAIKTFLTFYQVGNLPPSLSAIGKSKVGNLLTMFADTDTFRVWAEWRKNSMVSQLCWSMVETSRDIPVNQLLAAFAIEQGKEVLLASDVAMLIHRVENTIANVRAINAASSTPVIDDGVLCGHMLQHLIELNKLLSADPDNAAKIYSAPEEVSLYVFINETHALFSNALDIFLRCVLASPLQYEFIDTLVSCFWYLFSPSTHLSPRMNCI